MNKKFFLIFAILLFFLTFNTSYAGEIAEANTRLEAYWPGYNKYTNTPYGYEIVLPDNLQLNEDIVSVKSRFESDNLVVEVLYDDFHNTLDTTSIYNSYGNSGIKGNSEFIVTAEYNHNFNGVNGYIVLYERRKLSSDEPDRNYYATITFSRTSKEIVTVFMKSVNPLYLEYIMPHFKFIPKNGELKADKVFEPVTKRFDNLTQEFYDKYLKYSDKLSFGIFEPTFPAYAYRLQELENTFNYSFPVTLLYNSFELPYKKDYMNIAKSMGKVVEYTLYTTDKVNGIEKDITLDIIEGKYDEYLDNLAEGFNELDFPVLFRLNNEMNGAWVLYSSYFVGKDTDLYIECWRYIYNKFKEHGVDNVIFVWNPNELSFPNYSYNHYLSYYPGDEYVDVVGLTAYNTGNYYKGETWRSFSEAYDHFYYDYTNRFKHPMMITEFSCSSTGGNKAVWFDDLFNTICNYSRIKIAVLWNGQDYDTTKPGNPISRNYRIDQSEEIIQSIRTGLQLYK